MKQSVDAVLVSGDPAKACGTKYVTEAFLRRAYGGRQGCVRAQAPRAAASSLRSYKFASGSNHASVTVRPAGGLYDGEKVTVKLVKDGSDWKVDSLKSNAPVGP